MSILLWNFLFLHKFYPQGFTTQWWYYLHLWWLTNGDFSTSLSFCISWFPIVRTLSYLSADSCFLFDFDVHTVPDLTSGSSFNLAPCPFGVFIIILWVEFTFGCKRMFQTFLDSCTLSPSALKLVISPWSPDSFSEEWNL